MCKVSYITPKLTTSQIIASNNQMVHENLSNAYKELDNRINTETYTVKVTPKLTEELFQLMNTYAVFFNCNLSQAYESMTS